MREILYRGKRKDNGEWVYGYYLPYHAVKDTNGKDVFAQIFVEPDEKHPKGWAIVTAETVGQYTGLTDNNGKKIFEGDILRIVGCYFDVIYRNGGFVWRDMRLNKFVNYADSDSNIEQFSFVEVIGNIYDTPEMPNRGNDDCIYADFNKKAEV